jgi:FKBP-type peptidyl-prolyl cis-trans isomerase FkpA
MKKIKHLLLLVSIASCLTACMKNDTGPQFDFEAQFRADTTAIRSFIVANNIPAVKDNTYGFFYQIINPGSGTVQYSQSTEVTANYTGRLLNGTIFETTTGKTPAIFSLGGVIPGWQMGVPLIQKGGTIRLFIPSYYGYQNQAKGSIPPNSVLDFTIELVDVK